VSETFHRENLAHLNIEPLNELLHIECADGEALPYAGYIEANVSCNGIGGVDKTAVPCLLLVVPDSKYNSRVPLLLGTNILETLLDTTRERHGPRYLQTAKLTTPWYLAFRCMSLRERDLRRNQNRLAWV
jgi:hypothetical protein